MATNASAHVLTAVNNAKLTLMVSEILILIVLSLVDNIWFNFAFIMALVLIGRGATIARY